MRWTIRSRKKATGGVLKKFRSKRKYQQGGDPALTKIGEEKRKVETTLGGNSKAKVFYTKKVVVNTGKASVVADIEDVIETPDNPNYVRRKIMTKGSLINTSAGRARITSRPGQSGMVQAMLEKEKNA